MVHEGKKLFKCEICDISFGQKAALKKHLKNSHSDDKDIVKQEASEFKEEPTGIDEDDKFIGEVKPEPIEDSSYVE